MDEPIAVPADEIDEELAARVKPELRPGERLLWAGWGNRQGRRPLTNANPWVAPLSAAGCFLIGGVFLCAYLGHLGKRPFKDKSDEVAVLIFILISGGLGGLILLGWVGGALARRRKRRNAAKTAYALTDRRAVIWSPHEGTDAVEVYSYPWGEIRYVSRVEYPDGSGDVKFRFAEEEMYWGQTGFEGVADVRRVEELVRRAIVPPEPGLGS